MSEWQIIAADGCSGVCAKMDMLELILSRRSVRHFLNKTIPDEILSQVLQAGASAPSGGNVQAWGFVVVRSDEGRKGLCALAPGVIGEPAVILVLCVDERMASYSSPLEDESFRKSAQAKEDLKSAWISMGAALENLLLAAYSFGVGACPVGSFHRQGVACFLDLPQGVQPALLVAFGYPVSQPSASPRRPPAEIIYGERWGAPYGA